MGSGLNAMPYAEYVKLPPEAHPTLTSARDIVEALTTRGWAPAPVYPEGVQVWTLSGQGMTVAHALTLFPTVVGNSAQVDTYPHDRMV